MDIISKNPYRILGLTANATAKETSKRISDLQTFVELGKSKSYATDFPIFPGILRTADSVKDAAQAIEHDSGRVLASLFWFHRGNNVDELAMESLASGEVAQALSIWEKAIARKGTVTIPFSWQLNHAVLCLAKTAAPDSFNADLFERGLTSLGKLIDEHLYELTKSFIGGSSDNLDFDFLSQQIADIIFDFVTKRIPGEPYGSHGMGVLALCATFPSDFVEYLKSRTINPLITKIEHAIEDAEHARKDDPDEDKLDDCFGLNDVLDDFFQLSLYLDNDDLQFQSIRNKLAEGVAACAILANNVPIENYDIAVSLIDSAAKLEPTGTIRDRISENQKILHKNKNLEDRKKTTEPILDALQQLLEREASTLEAADEILVSAEGKLDQLRRIFGSSSEQYLDVSNSVVRKIREILVDVVNGEQESVKTSRNFRRILYIFQTASTLTLRLTTFDVVPALAQKVREDLETLADLNSNFHKIFTAAASKQGQSKCFIATAVYGTSTHRDLGVLRTYRDQIMLPTALGTLFVWIYYHVGPALAIWLPAYPTVSRLIRFFLQRVVVPKALARLLLIPRRPR